MAIEQYSGQREGETSRSTAMTTQGTQAGQSGVGLGKRVAGHAKDYLTEEMQNRRKKGSGDFQMLSKSLRLMSEQLEGNMASPLVGKIAARLDGMADKLSNADIRDVTRAASDFAKREPVMFYSGLFALGLGGARFLKCSAKTAIK